MQTSITTQEIEQIQSKLEFYTDLPDIPESVIVAKLPANDEEIEYEKLSKQSFDESKEDKICVSNTKDSKITLDEIKDQIESQL